MAARRAALGGIVAALALCATAAGAISADWPAYLAGAQHNSYAVAATTITTGNASRLVSAWRWTPTGTQIYASPTVAGGRVYVGANNGVFYALDDSTGAVLWQRPMGRVTKKTCGARGFTSTATVAPDPGTGAATVYVAAADGYLYALRADTGAVVWKAVVGIPSTTVNDYYNWASPAVSNGRVYMGVSSQCDNPFVRGGVKEYDQASGALLATFYSVASDPDGGGVWSSPAVSSTGSDVYITTASPCPDGVTVINDACSIVDLDGATLARKGGWLVPPSEHGGDSDFGGSPTLFQATINQVATPLVGACNKNGVYYAWRQGDVSSGPVWRLHVGARTFQGKLSCLAAAVWDGTRLFVAGNKTTIGGTTYQGSIRQVDPATGVPIWQRGLASTVLGSPSLDGAGVLAASTYNVSGGPNATYLVNAATGAILKTITPPNNSPIFAQPVFADGYLLVASVKSGLTAYRVGP
jgi:outer membrane protein assembly factor BamB